MLMWWCSKHRGQLSIKINTRAKNKFLLLSVVLKPALKCLVNRFHLLLWFIYCSVYVLCRYQGRLLSRLLTHTHLPGLSSLDQMHLLALADTVSTCNTDFAERFAIDAAKTAIAKENLSGMPEGEDISSGM